MKLIRKRNEFLQWRNELKNSKVGLVATMGNLHKGHLSLVRKALSENEHVVVTIFVNPKQFGHNEDFGQYPRTLKQDLEGLSTLEQSERITIFNPQSNEEIYPKNFQTSISVQGLDKVLCGKFRDGHFSGVSTIVFQLFTLSKATQAYFGQKDYQQFKIIERMTKDLMIPVVLHMCPIIREEDGLALSSRNQFLKVQQRVDAIKLYQALNKIKNSYQQHGAQSARDTRENLLKGDHNFQYLEILETENLSNQIPQQLGEINQVIVAGAYVLGDTRIIDNLLI